MQKKRRIRHIALVLLCALLCPLSVFADGDATVPTDAVAEGEALTLSAKCAVLYDADEERVLFGTNGNERVPIASTTKIMTAIVAIESSVLQKTVSVPKDAVGVEGSGVYLYEGEQLTVEQLLYALLLESANDAATAIAIEVGGSVERFSDMMNEKAAALGLGDTHYVNPHGLCDKEHYSSAEDLAKLTAYALKNETFAKIVSTYRMEIPLKNGEGSRLLINHNRLLKSYDGCIGVKTGYTKESGRCLVSAAQRDGLSLVAVTLDAPDDWRDHEKLLDYGFDRFERVRIFEAGGYAVGVPAVGAEGGTIVNLTNAAAIVVTLPKEHGAFSYTVLAPHFLYAPIDSGKQCGVLCVKADGKEICRAVLCSADAVDAAEKKVSFLSFLKEIFQ